LYWRSVQKSIAATGIDVTSDADVILAFVYTGAAIEGTATFDDSAIGGPRATGDYALLMRDDAYMVLGTTPFSVSQVP
jgi:hypothetical protein